MDANEQVVKPRVRNIPVHWSPPQENVYKANFDVALFDNMGYAGLGVVIRDCNGHIIAALSKKIKFPYSVEMAEALAAHRAVTFAKELSIFKVVVEGDCLWVVQALKALDRCKTLYGNVIEDTYSQGVTLQHCQFQHVRRDGNKLAHTLARRAILSVDTDVWIKELPSNLEDVFQSDLH